MALKKNLGTLTTKVYVAGQKAREYVSLREAKSKHGIDL
jgi:hypothetical protein